MLKKLKSGKYRINDSDVHKNYEFSRYFVIHFNLLKLIQHKITNY